MINTVEWCNWSFDEFISKGKWQVKRDCSDVITLTRGDSRNWLAYAASLQPTYQGNPPPPGSKCTNCHKYINGVNPYDDGQTWRK